MIKRVLCCVWISILGFSIALPLAGCQADNESDVDSGKTGTGDPKYTTGDDSGYRAFRKDHLSKTSEVEKGKAKGQTK